MVKFDHLFLWPLEIFISMAYYVTDYTSNISEQDFSQIVDTVSMQTAVNNLLENDNTIYYSKKIDVYAVLNATTPYFFNAIYISGGVKVNRIFRASRLHIVYNYIFFEEGIPDEDINSINLVN